MLTHLALHFGKRRKKERKHVDSKHGGTWERGRCIIWSVHFIEINVLSALHRGQWRYQLPAANAPTHPLRRLQVEDRPEWHRPDRPV